jgi:hypothetical protein
MQKGMTKWINRTMDFSKLLESRLVLYFFVVISAVNLYTNAVTGDGMYSVIFILVAFLTTFFSKNMISVLCIGVVVSNILKYGKEIGVQEGFDSVQEGFDSVQEGFEDKEEKISDDDGELEVDTLEEDVDNKEVDKSKSMKKHVKKEEEEELGRLLEYQNKLLEGVSKMEPILKSAQESLVKIAKMSETK